MLRINDCVRVKLPADIAAYAARVGAPVDFYARVTGIDVPCMISGIIGMEVIDENGTTHHIDPAWATKEKPDLFFRATFGRIGEGDESR